MVNIVIWGTGKIADYVLTGCQTISEYNIIGCIDNDEKKQGKMFRGIPIYSSDFLSECNPDNIVVLTDAYDEIYNQIIERYPDNKDKIQNKNFFFKESLLKRYNDCKDEELNNVISYIKKNGLNIFNYDFSEKYKKLKVDVEFDESVNMFFVVHNGKRMYMSKTYDTKEKVENYYRSILLEQDDKSPHKYLCNGFDVENGDVVVDVGVAEGNFSLDIIDKASKIFMVEADENWIEALKITFKDYNDKVVIVHGFASSYDESKFMTLDSIIDTPVNFIKMDIEGNEWDALQGAKKLIERSDKLKCAICSYHSDFDQTLVENSLDNVGVHHYVSKGYMWFPYVVRQNYISTRLVRGLVLGEKCGEM